MLKQRVITAVIMVAVLLTTLLWLPAVAFEGLVSLLVATGAWEWTALSGLKQQPARIAYTLSFVLLAWLLSLLPAEALRYLMLPALAWWVLALLLICTFPRSERLLGQSWILLLAGYLVLVPGWFGLMYLRSLPQYQFFILWVIALIAAADIGAYFSGRSLGRRKLAPVVSPNKTWEGFFGGVIATCLVAWIGTLMQPALQGISLVMLLPAAALLAALSVVGDLLESMLKRMQHMKDSGSLFPGHGGVMDRLDSLTAALPLYVLLLGFVL